MHCRLRPQVSVELQVHVMRSAHILARGSGTMPYAQWVNINDMSHQTRAEQHHRRWGTAFETQRWELHQIYWDSMHDNSGFETAPVLLHFHTCHQLDAHDWSWPVDSLFDPSIVWLTCRLPPSLLWTSAVAGQKHKEWTQNNDTSLHCD